MARIKITRTKIASLIAEGLGQGHGPDYKSWLRLKRGEFLPRSTHGIYGAPSIGRRQHIFSRNERRMNAAGFWLGAKDGREQFPLWPFPHPHPLADHPDIGDRKLPDAPGTLQIAKEMGIIHPRFPGTDIDYVLTIDVLFTHLLASGELSLTAGYAKSSAVVRADDFNFRTTELAELMRRACDQMQIRFTVWDELVMAEQFSDRLIETLPDSVLPARLSNSSKFADFILIAQTLLASASIIEILEYSAKTLGLSIQDTTMLYAHASWTQALPIDLSQPYITSQLAPTWNDSRRKMQTAFFGGEHA